MDVGIVLPVEGDRAGLQAIAATAREAELLGFHSIWTTDRLLTPLHSPRDYPYSAERGAIAFSPDRNWLDPIAVMGVVTGITSTIRIGVNVLVLPYRHPVVLAQEIASLDVLSGGRILLGVGIGWMGEEFDALGVSRRERAPRTDEHIAVMRQLWSTRGATSFHGRFTDFADMALAAKSVRSSGPPILIGGNSQAALARTARLGDGWAGVDLPPAEAMVTVQWLGELYQQAGRSIEGQVISLKRRLEPSGGSMLGAGAAELAAELDGYEEAGITLVIYDLMNVPDLIAGLRLIAGDVLPRLRPAG